MRKVIGIVVAVALGAAGLMMGGSGAGALTNHKLTISDYSAPEGQLESFQVTLTPPAENGNNRETVTVDFRTMEGTADGTDYLNKLGTLTFGPGSAAQRIDVPTAQDTIPEGNETFSVLLSNARSTCKRVPFGTCPTFVSITDGEGVGTIVDDDAVTAGSVAPTLVNFATQVVGTKSAPRDITITNTGTTGLQPGLVTITGTDADQFSRVNGCGSVLLSPNQTCTIQAFFEPTTTGLKAATLLWADNGSGSPHAVALRGTALAAPDTTAPDTRIDSGPKAKSRKTTATFTFSSEAGATFECSLDGADFAACTSPLTVTHLKHGSHVFRVRATDIAGNTDQTPATLNFKVKKH